MTEDVGNSGQWCFAWYEAPPATTTVDKAALVKANKWPSPSLRLGAIATLAAVLTACGGGGDSGGGTAEQAVPITATNAAAVGAEATDAGSGGLANSLAFLTGVQVSTDMAPAPSTIGSLASALRLILKVKAPKALVGVTSTETEQCPGGGSLIVAVNEASEARSTVGDSFQATFSNCVIEGATTNGALSVRLTEINANETLIVADLTASQFTAVVGGVGGRLAGSMRLTLDDTNSAITRITISGSFTADRLRSGNVRATRTVSNYQYTFARTVSSGSTSATFAMDVGGTFPTIGTASFNARSTQAFVTPSGATHPTSGIAKATGAGGSNVTVTVIAGGVRLDVDADGNGTVDATQNRTWAELEAQL